MFSARVSKRFSDCFRKHLEPKYPKYVSYAHLQVLIVFGYCSHSSVPLHYVINPMRRVCLLLVFSVCWRAQAQDPVGVLEGQIKDASGAMVSAADVTVTNHQTGFNAKERSNDDGSFHFASLPV